MDSHLVIIIRYNEAETSKKISYSIDITEVSRNPRYKLPGIQGVIERKG